MTPDDFLLAMAELQEASIALVRLARKLPGLGQPSALLSLVRRVPEPVDAALAAELDAIKLWDAPRSEYFGYQDVPLALRWAAQMTALARRVAAQYDAEGRPPPSIRQDEEMTQAIRRWRKAEENAAAMLAARTAG